MNIGTFKGEGTGAAEIAGEVQWRIADGPGWSREESFADPRAEKAGPLPKERGRFKGFYLNGNRVVLSYEVEGCAVLESPALASQGAQGIFVRSFTVGPSKQPLPLRLAQTGENVAVGLAGAPAGLSTKTVNGQTVLTLPPHPGAVSFSVFVAPAAVAQAAVAQAASLSKIFGAPQNLAELCQGGPARWPQTFAVQGVVAKDDAAWSIPSRCRRTTRGNRGCGFQRSTFSPTDARQWRR